MRGKKKLLQKKKKNCFRKRGKKKAWEKWAEDNAVKPQEAPRRKTWESVVKPETSLPKPPAADYGQDDAAPPKESELREQAALAAACGHCSLDERQLFLVLKNIRPSRYSGSAICEVCRGKTKEEAARKDEVGRSRVLVCLHCSKHCCELREHARQHAKKEGHWLAAPRSEPYDPICFKCDEEKSIKVLKEAAAWPIAVKEVTSGRSSGSANGHGNPVKGIPNRGTTCYVNATVQCLLALDDMRVWMLGPNAPTSPIGTALKELFVATNGAGGELKPDKLLAEIHSAHQQFTGNQDSHELLGFLRNDLRECAPTVIDSIFGGQQSVTKSFNCCSSKLASQEVFWDLSVSLASKERPAKCVSSPPRYRSYNSQWDICPNLIPATEENKMENILTIADTSDSQIPGSKLKHVPGSKLKHVVRGKAPKLLEVDSTEAEQVWQSIDSKSLASIEDCLKMYFAKTVLDQSCDKCSKVAERPNTNASKDGEESNENTTVDGGQSEQSNSKICQTEQSSELKRLPVECTASSMQQHGSHTQHHVRKRLDMITPRMICGEEYSAACSTANKDTGFHNGVQGVVTSCLPAEKQTNLLSTQCKRNASTLNEEYRKQVFLDGGHDVFGKLPTVLTIHLMRYTTGKNPCKVTGHVSFNETLDVRDFVDPRSKDKDNSRYRLVGVIEHRSATTALEEGHFVAYVRANRSRSNKQQRSVPSTWFCADDSTVEEVSLDEVLKCEAYMLFYERIKA